MSQNEFHVLLIEDNPDDIEQMLDTLSGVEDHTYNAEVEKTLADGLKRLDSEQFDIVILDLHLPDSTGLDTVVDTIKKARNTPVIILTATDDESIALRAVQMGAQDYLVKNRVDTGLLARSLQYAMERNRLQLDLLSSRRRENEERENVSFQRMSEYLDTPVTATFMGIASLKESAPKEFARFESEYSEILDDTEEMRIYKVEHEISRRLRSLAQDLVMLRAGPRDIIEIHTSVINQKSEKMTSQRYGVYLDEGRLVVLELMGYVAALYRRYSLGVAMRPIPPEEE
jgi:DNA-binding response OmpR family regulator